MKSGKHFKKHFRKAANTLCLPFIWTNKALKSLSGPKIEIFIWFNNSLESLSGPKKSIAIFIWPKNLTSLFGSITPWNLYLAQKKALQSLSGPKNIEILIWPNNNSD